MPLQVNARRGAPVAVQQPKRYEVAGLVSFATAILVSLALASWSAHGGRDWAGPVGAQLAETLIALLGTASLLLPISLALLSVRLFKRSAQPLRLLRAMGSLCIVVVVATALHLWWGDAPALGEMPAGGLVGSSVGELLRGAIGTAGAHTVVLTALLVTLVVRTRLSIVALVMGARTASGQGTGYLRETARMVLRAWRESRHGEPKPKRDQRVEPEALAEAALRPVIDARKSGYGTSDEGDEDPASLVERLAAGEDVLGESVTVGVRDGQDSFEARGATVEAKKKTKTRGRASRDVAPEPTPESGSWSEAPLRESAVSVRSSANFSGDSSESARDGDSPDGLSSWDDSLPAGLVLPSATESCEADSDDTARPSKPESTPARARPSLSPTKKRAVVSPAPRESALLSRSAQDDVESLVPEPVDQEPGDATTHDAVELTHDLEPAAALTIVTHEREIERAMKSAAVPVERTPAKIIAPERVMAFPSVELLVSPPPARGGFDENALRTTADRLITTLGDYTIEGRVMEVHPGPVVTTYEVLPAAGTKLAKIVRLGDDIAMSLEASKVRIVAPIPGKGRVGFEIPNAHRQTVYFRELVETEAFQKLGGALPVALGKDVVGTPYFADLATMPHLIVAGATGAGKSVGLNVMLASLLYKRGPEDVRLLMIDPKMVELQVYDGIPHMLLPVVTDMKKATLALRWVVDEMERRYALFAQTGSRNITTYNDRVQRAVAEKKPLRGLDGPVRTKQTGTTKSVAEGETAEAPMPVKLPYILCVVDEFADLIMVAGKEIEAAVARLAQKARAAGIHVILATQRPSVDVITGMIKANFPARIAFKVSQRVDSRTILDQQGAEHLLGRGDMLILPPGSSDLRRVHCAFVNEDEVQRVTDHWRTQGEPTYDEDILKPREDEEHTDDGPVELKVPQEKYERAVALVLGSRKCSTSYVQRYLGIGYNVAARIVDKMEREGIVGAPKGPGKEREVLG